VCAEDGEEIIAEGFEPQNFTVVFPTEIFNHVNRRHAFHGESPIPDIENKQNGKNNAVNH